MSAALIIAFLIELLRFLASPMGIAAYGAGVVLFLLMPFIPLLLGVGHSLANFHLGLAKWCISRAAIVLSEHDELLWKQTLFDDLGVEEITFGDTTKLFDDPDGALHHWGNTTFALADEVRGILFDPRHAAIGQRKRDAEQVGEMVRPATQDDWERDGVSQWIRGTFEMPTTNELVDLSAARYIIDGGERAEYPERVEKLYKLSRHPFSDRTPLLRLSMPIIAFLATFGGIWLVMSQGGGSGNTDSISYGALLMIGGGSGLLQYARRAGENIVLVLKYTILVSLLPLAFVGVAVLTNPIYAVIVFTVVGMGFWLLPFFALLGRAISPLGGALSRNVFLRLGMSGYRKPVLEWTRDGYRMREYGKMDTTGDVTWYGFAGGVLGFTYEPTPETFGADVIDHDRLKEHGEHVVTDGGSDDTLPPGFVRASGLSRADGRFGAFIPKRVSQDKFYLNSGIALQRFTNSAIGEKSMKKLLEAKDKYGAGAWGLSDKTLAIMTGGAILLAVVFWGVILLFL